jgi:hypothetical protein
MRRKLAKNIDDADDNIDCCGEQAENEPVFEGASLSM